MLSQPLLRAYSEMKEGGPNQEETWEERSSPSGGGNTCFHQGSCQGAFNQQRGQQGSSSVPDSQGPSSLAFSFFIWQRAWVLHCIHPWLCIPQPRAAAPRAPQLTRGTGVPCPTDSHSTHWRNSGNQQLQNPTSNSPFISFHCHLCPQSPPNLSTPLAAAAGGSA